MRPVNFYSYFAAMDEVAGWLHATTALMSNSIMEWQREKGIRGNICEIGVHHGRYFIALATALDRNELGIAIDLFSRQDENVDGSGQGDRKSFEAHVDRFLNPNSIVAIESNSLNLSADEITAHGRVRFFSVDGGHTEAATSNDLFLAENSIVEEGVVAVDDIMNARWSGVIGGVCRYRQQGGNLIGFAMVPNKLLMCRPQHAKEYRDYLSREYRANLLVRDAELLSDQIDTYDELPGHLIASAQRWSVDAALGLVALRDQLDEIKASRRFRLGSRIAQIYTLFRMRA